MCTAAFIVAAMNIPISPRCDVGVEHVVSWFVRNFLSQIRVDFLKISHVTYPEVVQPPASIFLGLFCRHRSLRAPVEIVNSTMLESSQQSMTPSSSLASIGHHCFLFSCSFLYSLRHCFKAACRDESLRAANVAEIVDVKQTEKIVPIITCELPSVSMSANWYSVSMHLIWILGSKLILSINQSSAKAVGSGNMSHHWTSSFDDPLMVFGHSHHGVHKGATTFPCVLGHLASGRSPLRAPAHPFLTDPTASRKYLFNTHDHARLRSHRDTAQPIIRPDST